MKAMILSTGKICNVLAIERTKSGVLYDIRHGGKTMRRVNEKELKICQEVNDANNFY